jgi:hypothetical protein
VSDDFSDDVDAAGPLDTAVWIAHYQPMWGARARTSAGDCTP